jgi:endonuclease/exonuclease/phosphatase family metal-dependent hydrolase
MARPLHHLEACASRLRAAAHAGPLPAILTGDFNVTPDSRTFAVLAAAAGVRDAFGLTNPGAPGLTVCQRIDADRPTVSRRVDYVFLAPGQATRGEVRASRVILNRPRPLDGGARWPSDHYGVLAEIVLPAPGR